MGVIIPEDPKYIVELKHLLRCILSATVVRKETFVDMFKQMFNICFSNTSINKEDENEIVMLIEKVLPSIENYVKQIDIVDLTLTLKIRSGIQYILDLFESKKIFLDSFKNVINDFDETFYMKNTKEETAYSITLKDYCNKPKSHIWWDFTMIPYEVSFSNTMVYKNLKDMLGGVQSWNTIPIIISNKTTIVGNIEKCNIIIHSKDKRVFEGIFHCLSQMFTSIEVKELQIYSKVKVLESC